MRSAVRAAAAALLSQPLVARALQPLGRGVVPIFLIHRVVGTPLLDGMDPEVVAAALELLRGDGYRFVSLAAVADACNGGRPLPRGGVAFTADDGYDDQAAVLAPIFERFECPLTIFLITGLLDRTHLPWYDRLEAAVAGAEGPRLVVTFAGERLDLPLGGRLRRRQTLYELIERYVRTGTDAAEAGVDAVESAAGVDVGPRPSGPYAPLTWDDARSLEGRGVVTFGPHTVTHPILAQASDERVAAEVDGSWARLEAELAEPLRVFCYPVGEDGDYGDREARLLAERGFAGAVTVGRRHARVAAAAADHTLRYRLDRIPLRPNLDATVFAATGVTRARDWVRDRAGRPARA